MDGVDPTERPDVTRDDQPGLKAGQVARARRLVLERFAMVRDAEERYWRKPDEQRQRIESRPYEPGDYADAQVELMAGLPVAAREEIREGLRQSLDTVERAEGSAVGSMLRDAERVLPIELTADQRRHMREVWEYLERLSPPDRDEWNLFFELAARAHPKIPSYLVLAVTRTKRGVQRAARQDWQLSEESARRFRLHDEPAAEIGQTDRAAVQRLQRPEPPRR